MRTGARPANDTVLFDGQCRFCRANVGIIQRFDLRARLRFVPIQAAEAGQWTADIPPADILREMYVVDTTGRRRGGVDAVRYLSRHLPALWPLALILHVPGTRRLWGWLYRKIAARRYWFGRVSCDSGSCSIE